MSLARSIRSVALTAGLGLATVAAMAAEMAFDKAKFDAAVAAGKPVVVEFSADWCPTCKAQKPIVQGLMNEPKFQPLTLFVANYDTETALKKELRVAQQSTFVVFKGGKEVGRSTGQTQKDAIGSLFEKAL